MLFLVVRMLFLFVWSAESSCYNGPPLNTPSSSCRVPVSVHLSCAPGCRCGGRQAQANKSGRQRESSCYNGKRPPLTHSLEESDASGVFSVALTCVSGIWRERGREMSAIDKKNRYSNHARIQTTHTYAKTYTKPSSPFV